MKKQLIPIALSAAVFAVSFFFQRRTLSEEEFNGLFLFSRDYFMETLTSPLPVSRLVSDFLLQLFYYPPVGAAVEALLICGIFILLRRLTAFSGTSIPATAIACTVWYFMAFKATPAIAVTSLIVSAALCVLVLPFIKGRKKENKLSIAASLIIIFVFGISIPCNGKVKENEEWAGIEYAARKHDWQMLLDIANPDRASVDRDMIPYALLALNATGRLQDGMTEYPVRSTQDLDMAGQTSRKAYYFNSILYEMLDVPNEAIHCTFQAACTLPHGTGNGMLRQLIKFNIMRGDAEMVKKYSSVLSRSPMNRRLALQALRIAEELESRTDVDSSFLAPVMARDPFLSLLRTGAAGNDSRFLKDRVSAYLETSPELRKKLLDNHE